MKDFWFDNQNYLHFCFNVPYNELWKNVYSNPEYKEFIEKERVGDPIEELKEIAFHFHAYCLVGLSRRNPTKLYFDIDQGSGDKRYSFWIEQNPPGGADFRAEVIELCKLLEIQMSNMLSKIKYDSEYCHYRFKIGERLYADYEGDII